MPDDASLDDFLDAGGDQGETAESGVDAQGDETPAGESEPDETGPDESRASDDGPDESGTAAADGDLDAGSGDAVDVESRAEGGESGGGDVESGDERAPPSSVGTATPTHEWTPDGAACDACGGTVQRRWRGEPGLVCEDCKDW